MNRQAGGLLALPVGFWRRVLLAWLVAALLLTLRQLTAIKGFELVDPDDALRLVQVRDLIAGQGWFELFQYRIGPPGGTATHWSRLVDLPIAGTILLLTPLLGAAQAELAALVIVPLLTLLCAMVLSARIAGRLLGAPAAWLSCLVWIMALPAVMQLQPMRIDHHGWQIVAVLAAVNGLLVRDSRLGGWIAGLALAAGLSISLELLPFTVLFAAVLGLRWLRDDGARGWPREMMFALSAGSIGLYLVSRGPVWAENHCDTISPAYLAGLAFAAMLIGAVSVLPRLSRIALIGLLGMAALLTGGLYLVLAPQCLAGPFAALDPLVYQVWYVNVLEGMPVWHQQLPNLLQMLLPPLAGLGALVVAIGQTADPRRRILLDLALLLAGSILVSIVVARFSTVSAALAVIPLGYGLAEWLRRSAAAAPVKRLAAAALIAFILLPSALIRPLQKVPDPARERPIPQVIAPIGKGCSVPASLDVIRPLAPATIFAPFEFGPSLLLHTRHRVIATNHHRASAGMRDVMRAFMAAPDQAEAIVRGSGATFVLACADLVEARQYQTRAPSGLMAQLLAGRSPQWLTPVALAPQAGSLRLWKVTPPADQPGRNSIASPLMQ